MDHIQTGHAVCSHWKSNVSLFECLFKGYAIN